MASISDIAKGKRITVALENYSTANNTDFVIGLGSLEGYLTKKYDANNNLVFASKWLSAPSIGIEQLHKDYKRTIKMRNSLPNPEAAILLLGYVAMNKKAYKIKM